MHSAHNTAYDHQLAIRLDKHDYYRVRADVEHGTVVHHRATLHVDDHGAWLDIDDDDRRRAHHIVIATINDLDRAVEHYFDDWRRHNDVDHLVDDRPAEFERAVRAIHDAAANLLDLGCDVLDVIAADFEPGEHIDDFPAFVKFVHQLASALVDEYDNGDDHDPDDVRPALAAAVDAARTLVARRDAADDVLNDAAADDYARRVGMTPQPE